MVKAETENKHEIKLQNKSATVIVNAFGGSIIDFHLNQQAANPLNFLYPTEQMPLNNRSGAPYQGHFLCLGRWGEPSDGERKAGLPDHGEIANILWRRLSLNEPCFIQMQVDSALEGLIVEREIRLDKENAIFSVEEKVMNIHSLGRLYNMVQHPTLSSPFLDHSTIVNCNASTGFDQFRYDHPEKNPLQWPTGKDDKDESFDLRAPRKAYNTVYSFIVRQDAEYGWITAYNPEMKLLLGYIWRRKDYPWIHLWQHWENNRIKYRGIEFGTAGIHKSFKQIIDIGLRLFGENTVEYIDAGEAVTRQYLSFLYNATEDIGEVQDIIVEPVKGEIILIAGSRQIHLNTTLKIF